MSAWKVRLYEKGDEHGIVRLHNLEGSENEYTMDRWRWRYKQNPYGFVTVVAEAGGDIVGHMGLFFMEMKIGKKTIMASQASELVVHPNYRRQGMFLAIGRKLMEEAVKANVFFTYGFPNEPAYHGHIQYGWFDVASIPVLSCLLNSSEATKGKKYHALVNVLSGIIDHQYQRKLPKTVLDLAVHERTDFEERINALWSNVSAILDMGVVRDQRYLNWRFVENPETKYKIFVAEDDNIEGYSVVSIRRTKTRTIGYIVDFLTSSEKAFRDLIASAMNYFLAENVVSVKCLVHDDQYLEKLKSYGFTSRHYVPQKLIARINAESFNLYDNNRRWFVTYGDCDFK